MERRIKTLSKLGEILRNLGTGSSWPGFDSGLQEEEYQEGLTSMRSAVHHNGWFTLEQVEKSFLAWGNSLTNKSLNEWTSNYSFKDVSSKKVGIIAAGNIPVVGLHDLVCVLLAGHTVKLKLSSKDTLLMLLIIKYIRILDADLGDAIEVVNGKLEGFDAVIATGSNNSARYFEYYFKGKPSIIRKNRTSVAVLTGEESNEELSELGNDIFSYYGLGCRNITKLYLPKGYDLDLVFKALYDFKEVANHNKYANNYDYHRAVWLMSSEDLIENGFILLKEESSLVSPVGTLYYEYYDSLELLKTELDLKSDSIQCIVSSNDVPFGQAQKPGLSDYADGVDTLKFLIALQ